MQDFPANSAKAANARQAPPEPKRIERITTAEPDRRRGLGRRFKDAFINGNARTAGEFMVEDVIVPAIRDTLYDAVQGGFEKLIYGDSRPRRGASAPNVNAGRVNYGAISSSHPVARTDPNPPMGRSIRGAGGNRFDDIVIRDRVEANEVLDQMFEILSRYGSVSVADLYGMVGIQAAHTDVKWGWVELKGARAAKVRTGGYLLVLPNPQPLG